MARPKIPGGGGRGGLYNTQSYTVTTRMTPALKIGGDEGFEERGEASGIKLRSFCLPAKRVIARPKQFKNGRASTVRLPYVTLSVNIANAYIHFVCKIYVI